MVGVVLVHFVLRPESLGPRKITLSDGAPESQEIPSTFVMRLSTISLGGQFLFLSGMGLLVLALTWAGPSYPWSDVRVIAPLVIGCLLTTAFPVWEYFMLPGSKLTIRYPHRKAIVPLKLFFTMHARLLIYINFITGIAMLLPSLSTLILVFMLLILAIAMYAVFYFVDLYFALVLDYGHGEAGTNLIYYTPGLGGE